MKADNDIPDTRPVLYRLEVAGRVGASWVDWFEADTLTPVGPNTVLDVRVADQAELYGRLRRIHDLNLRLVSVTRVGPVTRVQDQNEPDNMNSREDSK